MSLIDLDLGLFPTVQRPLTSVCFPPSLFLILQFSSCSSVT